MDEIKNIYNFSCTNVNGEEISLSDYSGKALLIVNTASKCGFTPQYQGLQDLYKEYSRKGLEILGFPCNQFGNQEPGSDKEISLFCSAKYDITFPLFSKIEVNGPAAHPLFKFLTSSKPGLLGSEKIKWNFTKFLIDLKNISVKRYAPQTPVIEIRKDLVEIISGEN